MYDLLAIKLTYCHSLVDQGGVVGFICPYTHHGNYFFVLPLALEGCPNVITVVQHELRRILTDLYTFLTYFNDNICITVSNRLVRGSKQLQPLQAVCVSIITRTVLEPLADVSLAVPCRVHAKMPWWVTTSQYCLPSCRCGSH